MTVRPGDVVSRASLLPVNGVVKLVGDAVLEDGSILAAADTHMMMLYSELVAACTFSFSVNSGLKKVLIGGGQKFRCMVDADRDGQFESAFMLISSKIGVPPPYGKIPSKRVGIRPVRFEPTALSSDADFPSLLLKYSHQDKITGHAYFGICIGNRMTRKEPCFDGYHGVRSDKLPKEFSVAGNVVTAVGKNGDAVTLIVKHGFAPMHFVGEERTVWVFY